MIKFFRLIIYNIYLHYIKQDNGNIKLAKFTIFIIFGIILLINVYTFYALLHLLISKKAFHEGPIVYVSLAIIVSIFLGYYLYSEKFSDFNRNSNYNKKYFMFFFLIIILTAVFYVTIANINRKRFFTEKGFSKELIENNGVEAFNPNKKPKSLEGKIKLWYYNNFEKKDTLKKK
ncbi:hypothetical protein [Chryseobacterium sp. JUb7]|uniref:hypothetical protein n=1 Tax=Chryseobacterium sp. JUb7 TaxID=2940599 RepID=UPI00216A3B20|nr:hypothetical protein [Chryseobacterium sp. JUb7]MCS3529891.1 magnesium-transporting ATPase (P-type) [Chryseobacterium sp. JUb7]